MPTEESTATATTAGSMVQGISTPMAPRTKAIFSTQEKQEPSICMVAPMGTTISATSLGMPVSSASRRLVGMVAEEEQVPSDMMAGLAMCWNMVLMPCLPPPI